MKINKKSNYFVNDKFTNLKCCNKFLVRNMGNKKVLVNHSLIVPMLQRRWGFDFCGEKFR